MEDTLTPTDPEATTLREAIALADPQGGDTIEFRVTGEIALTLGELVVDKPLVINGIVDGDIFVRVVSPDSRVFNIDDGQSGQAAVTIFGLDLRGANPAGDGGALYNAENLTLQQSRISGSTAARGGGLFNAGGLYATYSSFQGNSAQQGGAVFSQSGAVDLFDVTIDDNSAAQGGGVFNGSGDLEIVSSSVTGNTAQRGGGVYVDGGTAALDRSEVSENIATSIFRSGGGLLNRAGQVTVTRSTVDGNRAPSGDGGGLLNETGRLEVVQSTISGNSANDSGGGLYNVAGALTLRLSTVSGNSANDSGGGLYSWNSSAGGGVAVQSSTITGNTARRGGGVAANATLGTQAIDIGASIVWGNANGDVAAVGIFLSAAGFFQSNGYNLIGAGNAAGSFQSNDLTGVADAGLGPLADNEGPTWTHALVPGSPALDVIPVDPSTSVFDQRDYYHLRTVNGLTDIGSFEYEPPIPVTANSATLPGDFDGSGVVDHGDLTDPQRGFYSRLGVDLSGADFLQWQRNFGATLVAAAAVDASFAAEPAAAAATAPEARVVSGAETSSLPVLIAPDPLSGEESPPLPGAAPQPRVDQPQPTAAVAAPLAAPIDQTPEARHAGGESDEDSPDAQAFAALAGGGWGLRASPLD